MTARRPRSVASTQAVDARRSHSPVVAHLRQSCGASLAAGPLTVRSAGRGETSHDVDQERLLAREQARRLVVPARDDLFAQLQQLRSSAELLEWAKGRRRA